MTFRDQGTALTELKGGRGAFRVSVCRTSSAAAAAHVRRACVRHLWGERQM